MTKVRLLQDLPFAKAGDFAHYEDGKIFYDDEFVMVAPTSDVFSQWFADTDPIYDKFSQLDDGAMLHAFKILFPRKKGLATHLMVAEIRGIISGNVQYVVSFDKWYKVSMFLKECVQNQLEEHGRAAMKVKNGILTKAGPAKKSDTTIIVK